ncbi:MAG: dihydropteroate synthase [Verrucomicrobia bacterium]|nr:dihydropteroate synthase [Verrucomicrobiota bacterium]MBV9274195.1 dihydropteroate synthase [Verrucomicrobiota bacterium]
MGIVNINDDSFSGDGTLDVERAINRARALINAGADIVDVGGESARTNRAEISVDEEIARVAPFISRFAECHWGATPVDEEQIFPALLSINTWRPPVARALLRLGGEILNDMGALPDTENAATAAEFRSALVIMHSVGRPKIPHLHVQYEDIMDTLHNFFEQKITHATNAGMPRDALILDPGIDFAKQRTDNLKIYRDLSRLTSFGRPILLPVSRKTVIGQVLNLSDPRDRDAGTIACLVSGVLSGATLFRVHNVRAASLAVRTIWPVINAASDRRALPADGWRGAAL